MWQAGMSPLQFCHIAERKAMRNTCSLDEVADLHLEPVENARLRLANGGRAHAQLGGDGNGGLAVDGSPPERLPGPRLELVAQQMQGALADAVSRAEVLGRQKCVRLGQLQK